MGRMTLALLLAAGCGAGERGASEPQAAPYVDDFEEPSWAARGEPAARSASPASASPASASPASVRDRPRSLRHEPRVKMNLRNADLAAVFRELATLGGSNIVLSPSVKGTVTLRLDGVAWSVALASICQANDLEAIRDDNVILIRQRQARD